MSAPCFQLHDVLCVDLYVHTSRCLDKTSPDCYVLHEMGYESLLRCFMPHGTSIGKDQSVHDIAVSAGLDRTTGVWQNQVYELQWLQA